MFKIEISLNKETLAAINNLAAAIAKPHIEVEVPVNLKTEETAAAKEAADTKAKEAAAKKSEAKAKKEAEAKAKKEAAAKKKAEADAKAKEEAEAKAAEEKAQAEAAAKKKSDDAAAEAEQPEEETTEEPDDERVAPTVGVGQIRATLVAFGECYGKAKVVEVLQKRFNKTQLGQLDKSQYGDLYLALDAETEALGDTGIDPDCYEALLEALDACGGE